MWKRQIHTVHHDLHVADQIRNLRPHVVNPHRCRRLSSAGGRDDERLTSFQRRQSSSERKLLEIRNRQVMVRHNVEPDVTDVSVRTGEDGHVVDGEHSHVVERHELRVLHPHRQGEDAEAVVAEPEHCVSEHQAHHRRLRGRVVRGQMMLTVTGTLIRMERKRERRHPLHLARERG